MVGPGRQMHHEGVPSAARASAHRLLEVGSAAHAVRSGQHRRWCQAESSARPLRRRAARIARPARVRIRRRKPWVLARRRLFGWKVRLLTRVSNYIGWVSHVPRDQVQAARIDAPRTRIACVRRQGAPAGAIDKAAIPYFPPWWPVKCARLAAPIVPQSVRERRADVTLAGPPGPLASVIVAGGRTACGPRRGGRRPRATTTNSRTAPDEPSSSV